MSLKPVRLRGAVFYVNWTESVTIGVWPLVVGRGSEAGVDVVSVQSVAHTI